jgi:sugar lactone lactonase YvrE
MPPVRPLMLPFAAACALVWIVSAAAPPAAAQRPSTRAKRPDSAAFRYPTGLVVGPDRTMYVSSSGDSSIAIFSRSAGAWPTRRIGGPASRLVYPQGVALDSRGRIYVANGEHRTHGYGSITVYAPGARGNVAPLRRIQGEPATKLAQPRRIAVGRDGTMYVVNRRGGLLVFDAQADGAAAPRVIADVTPSDVGLAADGGLLVMEPDALTIRRDTATIRRHVRKRVEHVMTETQKRGLRMWQEELEASQPLFDLGPAGEVYVAESLLDEADTTGFPPFPAFKPLHTFISVYPNIEQMVPVPARRIVGPRAPHRNIIDIAVAGDGSLYVLFREQILVYGPDADGEVPPVRTIAGKRTGIANPTGLAVDQRGRLYLSNDGGRDANGVTIGSIYIFAPDADGDAAPIDTIAGTATRISRPNGVAVADDGSVYVVNGEATEDDLGSIAIFASSAAWDTPPLRTILGTSAFFVSPRGLALDPADTLYVIGGESRFVGRQRISVYPPGATGTATPVRILEGRATRLESPAALAFDRQGRLYVSDQRQASQGNVYGADRGAVRVYRKGARGDEAPIRTIMGSYTKLNAPGAIALDRAGNVYVPNRWGTGPGSVTVYGPADSGDVRPRRMIAGEATGLDEPTAVWLDRRDTLYVLNGRTVTVYPPGATGDVRPMRTVGRAP